jgi:UDP-N-acetylglucosamine acyltransferase
LSIHPTAIVSSEAQIAASAEVGPYCIIEGRVRIGERTVVESHARIGNRYGRVAIGADNLIQHGAVLGGLPQDVSYTHGDTALVIGDRNRIGEYASISVGTDKGGGTTRLGSDNLIMAFVHIGHDCAIADHVIITNTTQLAGHVTVEAHALLSGHAGVTQFCRLGTYSFLVAGSFANKDIPPYTIAEGHWATPRAINRIGLKRAGVDAATRRNLDRALKLLLDKRLTIAEAITRIRADCGAGAEIDHFVEFLGTSQRGVARA